MKRVSLLLLISIKCYATSVTIVGCGYVGLTMAAVLSQAGHQVTCVDIDKQKIEQLKQHKTPIYEPSLHELLFLTPSSKHLTFTNDIHGGSNADIFFICVPTPSTDDGSCDRSYLVTALHDILNVLPSDNAPIICVKSTVSPGTMHHLATILDAEPDHRATLLYNPEFMREGSAINDILNKNPVVLGGHDANALQTIQHLYATMLSDDIPVITTNIETAELIKYAWNSFSAIRIAYVNELARLSNKLNAHIPDIVKAIALSEELLPTHVLKPGPGYGGSCFPKDTSGFAKIMEAQGFNHSMIHQAINSNTQHKQALITQIKQEITDIEAPRVAILGLSFKAHTNDIRNSPAIDVIQALLEAGAHIQAYDPKAQENMQRIFATIDYCSSAYEATDNADCIVVLTEWPEIATLDLANVAQRCRHTLLFDTRNLYDTKRLKELGFTFFNMGKR